MTPKPTQKATMAQLRALKVKIAACRKQEGRSPWLIVATLQHQADVVARAFVDPQEETE